MKFMRMAIFLGALSLVGGLTACSEPITQADVATADFGKPIAQADCERIAKQTVLPILRDPGSAQFDFGKCEKSSQASIPIASLPKQFGYGMAFTVNARNGFGGYAGPRQYFVLIKDGTVVRRLAADDQNLGMFPF